jgi:hypothetical protein
MTRILFKRENTCLGGISEPSFAPVAFGNYFSYGYSIIGIKVYVISLL